MFKNIQFKMILIFFSIGIIIIGGFGIFFIESLNNMSVQIQTNQMTEAGQVLDFINNLKNNTKLILAISTSVFILVGILISVFLSKFVIYPINKLIKSAEKITDE